MYIKQIKYKIKIEFYVYQTQTLKCSLENKFGFEFGNFELLFILACILLQLITSTPTCAAKLLEHR